MKQIYPSKKAKRKAEYLEREKKRKSANMLEIVEKVVEHKIKSAYNCNGDEMKMTNKYKAFHKISQVSEEQLDGIDHMRNLVQLEMVLEQLKVIAVNVKRIADAVRQSYENKLWDSEHGW